MVRAMVVLVAAASEVMAALEVEGVGRRIGSAGGGRRVEVDGEEERAERVARGSGGDVEARNAALCRCAGALRPRGALRAGRRAGAGRAAGRRAGKGRC